MAKKTVWVRACDSFDSSDKALAELAKRIGHEHLHSALSVKRSCKCSNSRLFKVELTVTLVSAEVPVKFRKSNGDKET